MRGCGCVPRAGAAEEEWPRAHRGQRNTDTEEPGPFLRCRRCWRRMACGKSLRWLREKESCWNEREWTASTASCKALLASRPTPPNPKPKKRKIFFQAEDGIRDLTVTGVQTCALPI